METTKKRITETEIGRAGMIIELINGNIIVKHGSATDEVLLEINDAEAGSWDKIWNTLRNLKSIND
jgi:hypothetical protein